MIRGVLNRFPAHDNGMGPSPVAGLFCTPPKLLIMQCGGRGLPLCYSAGRTSMYDGYGDFVLLTDRLR
jgi:hypothetical protein